MVDDTVLVSSVVPPSAVFEVVHDKVAVRAAPSTRANILRALARGQIVQGDPMEIDGEAWLQLDVTNRRKIFIQQESAWMLIDGRRVGLGQLLRRLDSSASSHGMPRRLDSSASIESGAGQKARLCDRLSRSERILLQEACVAKYRTEDFQNELHTIWSASEGCARKQIEARAALCVKIHSLVFKALFKKHRGFYRVVSSVSLLLDIFQGHASFGQEDTPSRKEAELSSWLMWLLNPCAQKVHPRGLPPEISSSTASSLTEMSGTSSGCGPPRQRVLARVPVAVGRCWTSHFESSFCVEVLSGLSGDRLCIFSALSSNTVTDLKQQIRSLADIAPDEQKLIFGTRVLRDWESLCRIVTDSKLSGKPQQLTGDKLSLLLMRVDSERVSCLKSLETGALCLWDLESHNIEDPELALTSIQRNKSMLKFLPEALCSNVDFMMEAVRLQGDALRYASKDLQAQPEVVLAAVEQDGSALQHAAASLRNDRWTVLAAVENDGLALRFASAALQANLEVAIAATEQSGLALQYVHPGVAGLRDVAITALQQNKHAYKFLADTLRQDLSFLATLDNLGLFQGGVLEPLLWIESKRANVLLRKQAAVFIDARGKEAFDASHVPGALSLPHGLRQADVSNKPAYKVIMEHPSLSIIVYSDAGEETSHCVHVARQLRTRPEIQTHRVLRLAGGLNHWKHECLDIHGDLREITTGQITESLPAHVQAQDTSPFSRVKGYMISELLVERNHLQEMNYLESDAKASNSDLSSFLK